jgi:RHS repeat-associated protein
MSSSSKKTNVVSETVAADFQYAGMYKHERSGINLTLYRAYKPDLGRWISRDPIGEQVGYNLYSYVKNDPINWFDPLGLDALVVVGGQLEGSSNTAGHTAMATTDKGMYSAGNNYDFGMSPRDYIRGEALKRDQTIYTIKIKDKQQQKRIDDAMTKQAKRTNFFYDNCANRVQRSLNAGPLKYKGNPFKIDLGKPAFPRRLVDQLGALSGNSKESGVKEYFIPKGGEIPPELNNDLGQYEAR